MERKEGKREKGMELLRGEEKLKGEKEEGVRKKGKRNGMKEERGKR